MMNSITFFGQLPYRTVQSTQTAVSFQTVTAIISDNLTAKRVHHQCKVYKTLVCTNICNVTDKNLVNIVRYIILDQVIVNRKTVTAVCRRNTLFSAFYEHIIIPHKLEKKISPYIYTRTFKL